MSGAVVGEVLDSCVDDAVGTGDGDLDVSEVGASYVGDEGVGDSGGYE